jgi:hypothetical protein
MMARFNSASAGYAESYLLITILGLQHVAHDVRDVDLAGNAGDWSPGQQDKHDTGVQFRRLCKSLHNPKNWIHIDSEQAGPRVAAIVSIVETHRRLSIPVRDYLGLCPSGLSELPDQSDR